MKIVHLGTQIQTTFGLMDEEGNVADQQTVQATVPRFEEQAFVDAFEKLAEARNSAGELK